MSTDYYEILGVDKTASEEEIKKAYKKKALLFHPDRNTDKTDDEKNKLSEQFKKLSEAFEILSDKEKRKTYDKFGIDGLKNNGFQGFHNAEDIFSSVFGQFGGMGGGMGGMPGGFQFHSHGGMGGMGFEEDHHDPFSRFQQRQQPKPKPKVHPIGVSLIDLYNGCTKKFNITRSIIDASGSRMDTKVPIQIDIKPGWKDGTKLTFHGKGDEVRPNVFQDIQFVIKQQPHDEFERVDNDLKTKVRLSLKQSLCGFEHIITAINGKKLKISTVDNTMVMHSGQTVRYSGYGMPISKRVGQFGDLIVEFFVDIPTHLTKEQRDQLAMIL